MNTTYFVHNFDALFSTYSPLTNQSVWWFNSLTEPLQSQIAVSLCHEAVPVNSLLTFSQTFVLSETNQHIIDSCTPSGAHTTAKFETDLIVANPYTPGARRWFLKQKAEDQVGLLSYICKSWGYSPWQTVQVLEYYLQDKPTLPKDAQVAADTCISSARFLMFPYVDFHWDWLAIQTENTKRRLLVLLCADMTVGTLELTKIFIRQLQRNTTIHESTARCILMRDMTIHDVYRQYQLKNTLSDDAKFWFAIRNSTEKELTIDYLFGGYIFYDQGPPIIYTLPQLVAIMNGYIKYLYDLEFPVQSLADRANAWFFEYMKFKSFPGEGHWGFNLVWFGSQNSSVQLEAVRELCTNPVYTPATVYSVFKTFFRLIPLEPEIHNEMRRCPKDKQSMSDHVALVSMFLGCAGFCGLMIVLFSLILYLEFRSFEKPNEAGFSHFNLVMLASLLCLLGEDIANAWFINSAIYNFETMISSTITGVSVVYSLTFVFNCGWSFSFLHLSYVRSESLVHLIWPTTYQYIKRAFLISPIVFLAPIIISALEIAGVATATLTWTSYAVSEVYLFVLDLVLLFTFIKFVRGVYVDSDISNQQFNAISRFSSVSSFLCLLITLSALARPIITEYTAGTIQAIYICVAVGTVLMHVSTFVVLCLKWKLLRDRIQKQERSLK